MIKMVYSIAVRHAISLNYSELICEKVSCWSGLTSPFLNTLQNRVWKAMDCVDALCSLLTVVFTGRKKLLQISIATQLNARVPTGVPGAT